VGVWDKEIININMSLDKFTESSVLQKEMDRLDIEEKNSDSPR